MPITLVPPPPVQTDVVQGFKPTTVWQRWLSALRVAVNATEDVTEAIATGTTVAHRLPAPPVFVLVTAQDSGPTDVYVDTLTDTTFMIHFGGGGSHVFGWRAVLA